MSSFFIIAVIIAIVYLLLLRKKKSAADKSIKASHPEKFNVNLTAIKTEDTVVKKNKYTYTWGEFDVVGYNYLAEDIKNMIDEELNDGDILRLKPDPGNVHDSEAVKVLFDNSQIGWVPKDFYRKKELFRTLIAGKEIEVECLEHRKNKTGYTYKIRAKFKIEKAQD